MNPRDNQAILIPFEKLQLQRMAYTTGAMYRRNIGHGADAVLNRRGNRFDGYQILKKPVGYDLIRLMVLDNKEERGSICNRKHPYVPS
jgi:hypothetical protein